MSRHAFNPLPYIVAAVAVYPSAAVPTYLVSQGATLYRQQSGAIESFPIGIEMMSMFYDGATNRMFVGTRGVPGNVPLFVMNNAESGTPSLEPFAVLDRFYGTLTRIGELYYGFHEGELHSVNLADPANPQESLIGSTGFDSSGGCAYDPASETLYLTVRETDGLYRVDPATGSPTLIGTIDADFGGTGLEWWDGRLFVAAENFSSGEFEVGTLDTATASFDLLFSVGVPARPQSTSLGIVPEPAALTLGLLGLGFWRRTRR